MEKIEKARKAPIGAIHTWRDGLQYIKRGENHWVPYRYDYSRGNIDPKKEVGMINDGNVLTDEDIDQHDAELYNAKQFADVQRNWKKYGFPADEEPDESKFVATGSFRDTEPSETVETAKQSIESLDEDPAVDTAPREESDSPIFLSSVRGAFQNYSDESDRQRYAFYAGCNERVLQHGGCFLGTIRGSDYVFPFNVGFVSVRGILDAYRNAYGVDRILINFRREVRDENHHINSNDRSRFYFGAFFNFGDNPALRKPADWNVGLFIKKRGNELYKAEAEQYHDKFVVLPGGTALYSVLGRIFRIKHPNEIAISTSTMRMDNIFRSVREEPGIEKARKGEPLGSRKVWGSKVWVKTERGWRQEAKGTRKDSSVTTYDGVKVMAMNVVAVDEYTNRVAAYVKYNGESYAVSVLTPKLVEGTDYVIRPTDLRYLSTIDRQNPERDLAILDALRHTTYPDFQSIGAEPVVEQVTPSRKRSRLVDSFGDSTLAMYEQAKAGEIPVSDLLETLIDSDYPINDLRDFVREEWPGIAEALIYNNLYGNEITDMRAIKKKYVNKTESSYEPMATHISTSYFEDNKALALRVMQAMKDIQGGYAQGTLTRPAELASSEVDRNGKTIAQALLDGDEIRYNDGWYIVEVDADYIYVDVTGNAMSNSDEYNNYKTISDLHIDQLKKSLYSDSFSKARTYPIGSERTWKGVVYVKTINGWVPKKKGNKSTKIEDTGGEKRSSAKDEEKGGEKTAGGEDEKKRKTLEGYAKEATDKQLENAINKEGQDAEVKEIAEKELEARKEEGEKKETAGEEKKDKSAGKKSSSGRKPKKKKGINHKKLRHPRSISQYLLQSSSLEDFAGDQADQLRDAISKADVSNEEYEEIMWDLNNPMDRNIPGGSGKESAERRFWGNNTAQYYLDSYMRGSQSEKLAINKALIESGKQPIVDGMMFGTFDGVDYTDYSQSNDRANWYDDQSEKIDASKEEKESLKGYITDSRAMRSYSTRGEAYEPLDWSSPRNNAYNQRRLDYMGNIATHSTNISSYIDKNRLDSDIMLYRSLRMNSGYELDDFYAAEVGDVIEDKSFSSFSLSASRSFGTDMQITLLAKKGDPVANTGNDVNLEYIADKNSRFKVIAKGLNSMVVQMV